MSVKKTFVVSAEEQPNAHTARLFSQLAGSPHFSHFPFVQNNYLVCIRYGPHAMRNNYHCPTF